MKTNWKKVIHKRNAADHKWPEGWSTREEVAEEMECSPDRVHTLLLPAIKAGDVEVQDFPVWDDLVKRVVRVRGYRERPARPEKAAPAPDAEDVVKRIAARHPAASPREIQKLLPRSFRGKLPIGEIRAILA